QKVIVVGEADVTAYRLEDGAQAWSTKLDEGVRVSGRGIVAENSFFLPLNNGELKTIDLSTGKVLSQTYVASGQPPLGNLSMHHGKLVSLSPTGLTGFGQRDAVLAEISQRLENDANDPQALLRSSEIQLLDRKYDDAIAVLRRLDFNR